MERRAAVLMAEQARMNEVRSLGFVPDAVGPEIPMAPARGPVRMFESMAYYPKGEDDFELKAAGYMGRKTLQRADSFDNMAAKAARHKKPSPFSPAQVAMGRFYRDLVEKHSCAGVKCSSLESVSQGGGSGGGEFMDAVLRDRQRIDVLRQRIGSGSAMVVRRIRPSDRGSKATIMDRRLIDAVCIEDSSLTDVLRAHGWVREGHSAKGDHIKALATALAAALDRMMGPVKRGGISVIHFGSGQSPIWD
ncbi:hypothetical protein GN241_11100 [Rhodobacteraceae bacterium IMCC1335]